MRGWDLDEDFEDDDEDDEFGQEDWDEDESEAVGPGGLEGVIPPFLLEALKRAASNMGIGFDEMMQRVLMGELTPEDAYHASGPDQLPGEPAERGRGRKPKAARW